MMDKQTFPKIVNNICFVAVLEYILGSLKQVYYENVLHKPVIPVYYVVLPVVCYLVDAHVPCYWVYVVCQIGCAFTLAAYSLVATDPLNLPKEYIYIVQNTMYVFSRPIDSMMVVLIGCHFVFPDQEDVFKLYITFFWWATRCVGFVIGDVLGRVIKSYFTCYGRPDCTPACIYFSFVLIVICIFLTLGFKKKYIIKWPKFNAFYQMFKMMTYAIRKKCRSQTRRTNKHWLDYAKDKYDKEFIDDVKKFKFLSIFFIPWIVAYFFDAIMVHHLIDMVFNLKSSGFSATYINIFADSMYSISMILTTPILEFIIYPWLSAKQALTSSLGRFNLGLIFLLLSALCTAILWNEVEKEKSSQFNNNLRIFNPMEYNLEMTDNLTKNVILIPYLSSHSRRITLRSRGKEDHFFEYTCGNYTGRAIVELQRGKVTGLFLTKTGHFVSFEDRSALVSHGLPIIRFIDNTRGSLKYTIQNSELNFTLMSNEMAEIAHGIYNISIDDTRIGTKVFSLGGIYVILVNFDKNGIPRCTPIITKDSNKIHLFWILPQCILGAIGTTMTQISIYAMAYVGSPDCAKCTGFGFSVLAELTAHFALVSLDLSNFVHNSTKLFIYCTIIFAILIFCLFLSFNPKWIDFTMPEPDK